MCSGREEPAIWKYFSLAAVETGLLDDIAYPKKSVNHLFLKA